MCSPRPVPQSTECLSFDRRSGAFSASSAALTVIINTFYRYSMNHLRVASESPPNNRRQPRIVYSSPSSPSSTSSAPCFPMNHDPAGPQTSAMRQDLDVGVAAMLPLTPLSAAPSMNMSDNLFSKQWYGTPLRSKRPAAEDSGEPVIEGVKVTPYSRESAKMAVAFVPGEGIVPDRYLATRPTVDQEALQRVLQTPVSSSSIPSMTKASIAADADKSSSGDVRSAPRTSLAQRAHQPVQQALTPKVFSSITSDTTTADAAARSNIVKPPPSGQQLTLMHETGVPLPRLTPAPGPILMQQAGELCPIVLPAPPPLLIRRAGESIQKPPALRLSALSSVVDSVANNVDSIINQNARSAAAQVFDIRRLPWKVSFPVEEANSKFHVSIPVS